MPPFITQAIENFLNGQGASLLKSAVTGALVWIVAHLHANGLVTPTTEQAWAATVTTAVLAFLVHWIDNTFGNSNVVVKPVSGTVVATTTLDTTTMMTNALPNAAAPVTIVPLPDSQAK